MTDFQFWKELAASFTRLLASCKAPINVEWRANRPEIIGSGKNWNAVFGEGGIGNHGRCNQQFMELAQKAGKQLPNDSRPEIERWLNALATHFEPIPSKDPTRGMDSRFEDVVRLSAQYSETLAEKEGAKPASLAYFDIPDYLYFPTHLRETQGPKQWAKMRFLQACERLKIPKELWPNFQNMSLPSGQYSLSFRPGDSYSFPEFNVLFESEAEWRDRARRLFENELDKRATQLRNAFQQQIKGGLYFKIKPIRGASLELRYDWAVRRHCLKQQYKEMSSEEFSAEQIRKLVDAILVETGLKRT